MASLLKGIDISMSLLCRADSFTFYSLYKVVNNVVIFSFCWLLRLPKLEKLETAFRKVSVLSLAYFS